MHTASQSLLWGGKKTIDPPMPSSEEKVRKDNDKVVESNGEAED